MTLKFFVMFGLRKKAEKRFANMDMSEMSASEVKRMQLDQFGRLVIAAPLLIALGIAFVIPNIRTALQAHCFSDELNEAIESGRLEFTTDTAPLKDVRRLARQCKDKLGVFVDEDAITIPMDTYHDRVLTHLGCDPTLAADAHTSAVCREIDRKWHQKVRALQDSGPSHPSVTNNDV